MVVTLKELLANSEYRSYSQIAGIITAQYDVALTRSAIAGKVARDGLAGLRTSLPPRINKPRGKTMGETMFTLPPPTPEPEPESIEQLSLLNCTLFELRSVSCRWPTGVNERGEHLFCGVVKPVERSYCPEHHQRSYVGTARKRV